MSSTILNAGAIAVNIDKNLWSWSLYSGEGTINAQDQKVSVSDGDKG